ncbi:M64 family metallopeptidase [Aerosakkonemataceae cyanobacterium BLCC-F50]|uniref:M64 family metallopeptidase n=1 Tax=Floridaenema flaviceps BLCC-F50 TaxID=3153642 RepID=A0ABV4XZG7_9CYAN
MLNFVSKNLRLSAATISMVLGIPAVAQGAYLKLWDNGPSSNRVDIVFLGDGYTAADINTTYNRDINAMLNWMFFGNENPYPRYKNFFNVHRLDIISPERGADIPPAGIFRNTALDASYYFDGVTDRLLYINEAKAKQALVNNLPDPSLAEVRLVTVNDTKYGGGGGNFAVYAGGNSNSTEVALHELGHSFNKLADEYDYNDLAIYRGLEPTAINITKSATGNKWSQWLGYVQPGIGVIGAYEGAGFYQRGLFRPSMNSKMRSLGQPFDAVSREKIILDIYDLVNPLDSWLDNTITLFNPDRIWVKPIDPNVINVNWYVNDILIPGAINQWFDLANYGFDPGFYKITAKAFDPTDWVRINRDRLEQSITWNVEVSVSKRVPEPGTLLGLFSMSIFALVSCAKKGKDLS